MRYSWDSKPQGLLSVSSLSAAGFKLAPDQPVRGMVQSNDGKSWYWLYHINEAQSKKPGRSPEEGLRILEAKRARKWQRERDKAYWEQLDYRTRNLLWKLNGISHLLEEPESFPFKDEEYWRRVKESRIKYLTRDIRLYIKQCKETLFELYPPARPQPGDVVLGGNQKQPQPYDAVLGTSYK
jgi:hypothetical protein